MTIIEDNCIHLRGMLDRDQRTAKLTLTKRRHDNNNNEAASNRHSNINNDNVNRVCFTLRVDNKSKASDISGVPLRKKRQNPCRNGHFWKSLLRLRQAFLLGVYLSLIADLPRSFSAPAASYHRRLSMTRRDDHPKWINPCGTNLEDLAPHGGLQMVDDEYFLNHIVNQAKIAFNQADDFKDKFAKKTFKYNNSQDLHNAFKDQEYDWLPTKNSIPKKLGESTSQEHLKSLQLDTALLDAYESLQKVAVGLEQVVWDQEDHNGEFKQSFNSAQYELRNILCEIQNMIIERNITMRPDVTRDLMPEEIRKGDDTARAMRDWLIYRSYLTTLEYLIDVFSYFQQSLMTEKEQ